MVIIFYLPHVSVTQPILVAVAGVDVCRGGPEHAHQDGMQSKRPQGFALENDMFTDHPFQSNLVGQRESHGAMLMNSSGSRMKCDRGGISEIGTLALAEFKLRPCKAWTHPRYNESIVLGLRC